MNVKFIISQLASSDDENSNFNIFQNNDFIINSAIGFADDLDYDECEINYFTTAALSVLLVNEFNSLEYYTKQNNIIVNYLNGNVYNINFIIPSLYFGSESRLHKILKITSLTLNIRINPNTYPFKAPRINIINPCFNNSICVSINSIDAVRNWTPFCNIIYLIENIRIFLNTKCDLSIQPGFYDEYEAALLEQLACFSIIVNKKYKNNLTNKNSTNKNSTNKNSTNKNSGDFLKGTGYSSGATRTWDAPKMYEFNDSKNKKINKNILNITRSLALILTNKPDYNISYIYTNSEFVDYILKTLKESSLLDLINDVNAFSNILNFLRMTSYAVSDIIVANVPNGVYLNGALATIYDDCLCYIKTLSNTPSSPGDERTAINNFIVFYEKLSQNILDKQNTINALVIDSKEKSLSINEQYYEFLKDLQLCECNSITNKKESVLSASSTGRIVKEYITLRKSLPLNINASIFFRFSESNCANSQYIITGPTDTPYDSGCFLFEMQCPNNYPDTNPSVKLLTTGSGLVRFNPNLYNCGKVCLSLLGTWESTPEEQWIPGKSTLLQILMSIQSLIFVSEPYYNEPGHQFSIGTQKGINASISYNQPIRYYCIKYAMYEMLNNPPPGFETVVYLHFKTKANYIKTMCKKWLNEYN
ncbi:MAG: hypothetical protein EOP34_07290, partial [Rickettsiales bacterium]